VESAAKAALIGNPIHEKFVIRLMPIIEHSALSSKSYEPHTSIIQAS